MDTQVFNLVVVLVFNLCSNKDGCCGFIILFWLVNEFYRFFGAFVFNHVHDHVKDGFHELFREFGFIW